jgi:hypothetical protein
MRGLAAVQWTGAVAWLPVAATLLSGCLSSPVSPTPSPSISHTLPPTASPATVARATDSPVATVGATSSTTSTVSPSPRALATSAPTASPWRFVPTGWQPFDDLAAGELETIVLDHPGPHSRWSGQVVAWNGVFYIGLGPDGGVLTSVDGRQWSDIPALTAWQVAAAGSRLFGWGGEYWWWTDDGVQWSRRRFDRVFTAEEPNYAFVNAVGGAASGLYAVGGIIYPQCGGDGCPLEGAAWRSDDGEDWERIDIGEYLGPWTEDEEVEWELLDLVATPDRLVILGNDFISESWTSWVSRDGSEWSRVPFPPTPRQDDFARITIANGGGERVFALRGFDEQDSGVLELTDTGWLTRASFASERRNAAPALVALATTPGGYVLAGSEPATDSPLLWASTDGDTWRRVPAPDDGWVESIAVTENHIVIAAGVGPGDPSRSNLAFLVTP